MKIEVRKITPECASYLIESNTHNRKLRERHIQFLEGQMKNGEWMLSPQGIALEGSISQPERVLDGQHRLHAIARSGKTVEIVVSEFCDPAVYGIIDTGIPRNLADLTGINRKVIDVVGFLIAISKGDTVKISSDKMISAFKEMKPIIDLMGETFMLSTKIIMQAPIRAAFAARVMESPSRASELCNIMMQLSRFDTNGLPPIWASWLKRMHSGSLSSAVAGKPGSNGGNRIRKFAITWDACDPNKSENARTQIKSDIVHIEAARVVLRAHNI